ASRCEHKSGAKLARFTVGNQRWRGQWMRCGRAPGIRFAAPCQTQTEGQAALEQERADEHRDRLTIRKAGRHRKLVPEDFWERLGTSCPQNCENKSAEHWTQSAALETAL